MADIQIQLEEQSAGWQAKVTVQEGGSSSQHVVNLDKKYFDKLSQGKYNPQQIIETSFEFLLAREPKESILGRFDLPVIGRYFREYEQTLSGMLTEKYG